MTHRAGQLVVESLEVISESVASDHRPIVATLRVAK
jgi:endonuclease/exonuclease/phosphatase family metal-dependent hydrolase